MASSGNPGQSGGHIEAVCPYEDCGARFKAPPAYAGKKGKCGKCKRRFVINPKSGEKGKKVADEEATKIEGTTRNIPAQDALEPVKKGGDALEPVEKAPSQEPAAGADEMSLDSGGDKEDEKGGGPSPSLGSLDDMDLVSKPEKSSAADAMAKLEEEQEKEMGTGIDDLDSAGLITDEKEEEEEEEDEDEDPKAKKKREKEKKKKEKERPTECPHCGVPVGEGGDRCPVCGERYDAPVQLKGGDKHAAKKRKGFKKGVTVACVLLILVGAFVMYQRMGGDPSKLLDKAKQIVDDPSKVVEDAKGLADKVKSEARKAMSDEIILVVTEDKTELEESESPIPPLRKGQPVVQIESSPDRFKVKVKTPDGVFEGWVSRDDVKASPDYDPADVLGYDQSQPRGHQTAVVGLYFKSDGKFAASIAKDGREVNIWNTADSKLVRIFHRHPTAAMGVGFIAKGTIASAAEQGGLRIWDPITTATLATHPYIKGGFFLMKQDVFCLEFASGRAKVRQLGGTGDMLGSSPEGTPLLAVRISNKETFIVALTEQGQIQTYSTPKLEPKEAFDAPSGTKDFDLSPDGEVVLVFPEEGKKALLLERTTGKKRTEITLEGLARMARFCGGEQVAAVTEDLNKVAVYSAPSSGAARKLKALDAPEGALVTALATSKDGKKLAIGYSTGAVEFHALDASGTGSGGAVTGTPGTGGTTPKPAPSPDEKKAKRAYDFMKQFLANKMPDNAKTYYQKLVKEFPDSPYTAKAKEELEKAGVKLD